MSSLGTARAGMIYSLTCNVSKTVDGLINSPTAIWTTGGVPVSNGNGITVSTTLATSKTTTSVLTFDPLKTSHNGLYSCGGTLTSPALNEPLVSSVMVKLSVQSELAIILYISYIIIPWYDLMSEIIPTSIVFHRSLNS